jgi:hypothetical protein
MITNLSAGDALDGVESFPILRWVFRRGNDVLTCGVDASRTGAGYDICIVPHWDVASTIIEGIDSPVSALRRHAEIACALRDAGWFVATRCAGL